MFSGYNVSLFGEKNKLIAVLLWFRIFIFSGRKKNCSHMLIDHYLLNYMIMCFLLYSGVSFSSSVCEKMYLWWWWWV